ncbi:MAG: hypothetical protein ACRD5G_04645 [Candidatus Acidiferrales bacterium]
MQNKSTATRGLSAAMRIGDEVCVHAKRQACVGVSELRLRDHR